MQSSDGGLRTFRGAVAIVTGGASGIGRAIGEDLAQRGADVVLADLQAEVAEQVAEGIRRSGGSATAVDLDVTRFEAVEALVEKTVNRAGRVDYMFNNAGIAIGGETSSYRIDDWRKVLDVNLNGVVHGVQAVYPLMIRQGFGHIVNTASVAGLLPMPLGVSYATTKHAVVGLSKSLRVEAERRGVRVSVMCPGVIRTPILTGGVHGRLQFPMTKELALAMWERLRPIEPQVFAKAALNAVARNKQVIVIPRWYGAICTVFRLSPSLELAFSRKSFADTVRSYETATAPSRIGAPK